MAKAPMTPASKTPQKKMMAMGGKGKGQAGADEALCLKKGGKVPAKKGKK